MSELRFTIESDQISKSERLTLGYHNLKGTFRCFSGKSGEYWISLIPSLKVSGYGNSEEDSLEDLRYNLNIFCDDLFGLDRIKRQLELQKLGWSQSAIFKKKFSAAFVDKEGVLRNFDHPEQVKDSILQTA